MHCPSDNLSEMTARYEVVCKMFGNLCPDGTVVKDVSAFRKQGDYKCAWNVEYARKDDYDGPDLLPEILTRKPKNTSVVKTTSVFIDQEIESIKLSYSLICTCLVSPNPRKFKNWDWLMSLKNE